MLGFRVTVDNCLFIICIMITIINTYLARFSLFLNHRCKRWKLYLIFTRINICIRLLYFSVVTDPEDVSVVLNKCLNKMFVYKFIEPMVGKMLIAAEGILFIFLIKNEYF